MTDIDDADRHWLCCVECDGGMMEFVRSDRFERDGSQMIRLCYRCDSCGCEDLIEAPIAGGETND